MYLFFVTSIFLLCIISVLYSLYVDKEIALSAIN